MYHSILTEHKIHTKNYTIKSYKDSKNCFLMAPLKLLGVVTSLMFCGRLFHKLIPLYVNVLEPKLPTVGLEKRPESTNVKFSAK